MTTLSVIIPCYNEESRLGPTLEAIGDYLAERVDEAEVIVVDDGSTDATAAVAERSTCPNLAVLRTESNRGKGHAVRVGMLAASGDLRLFADADGSTPIAELAALEKALDELGGTGISFA